MTNEKFEMTDDKCFSFSCLLPLPTVHVHHSLALNTSTMISRMNKSTNMNSAIFQRLYGRSPCISLVRPFTVI